jgi:hypothetical protein
MNNTKRILFWIPALIAVAALAANYPELRRYLRVRRM